MTTRHRYVPFVFNAAKFGRDVAGVMMQHRLSTPDLAEITGLSSASIRRLVNGEEANPHMLTFLRVCNACDLNANDYIELEG